MNPAHITTPFRLGGFVAANCIASGVENDSATSTNGFAPEVPDPAKRASCSYDRKRSVGYRNTSISNASGRPSMKFTYRFPVPSIPGRRISLRNWGLIKVDHQVTMWMPIPKHLGTDQVPYPHEGQNSDDDCRQPRYSVEPARVSVFAHQFWTVDELKHEDQNDGQQNAVEDL